MTNIGHRALIQRVLLLVGATVITPSAANAMLAVGAQATEAAHTLLGAVADTIFAPTDTLGALNDGASAQ